MKSFKGIEAGRLFTARVFALGILTILSSNDVQTVFALPSPPNPGDSVLIIYITGPCNGDGSYNQTGATRLQAALNAIPAPFTPTVTMLGVPCSTTTSPGLAPSIPSTTYLNQFCEVWDLRFMANPSTPPCTNQQADVITSSGANNDTVLFQNFLAQGGHLYLGGDNGGFCPRNNSVINFVNSVTGCSLPYPNTFLGTENWTTFDNTAPDNFATNDNTLANLYTFYPGRIPLGSLCGAKALASDGTYALSMLWQGSQLPNVGNGKLYVEFDTNYYSDAVVADIPDNHYIQYAQNVYTALAGCFNYTMNKTVNPTSVCVGQPVTYTICVNNTGTKAIPNPQITDTLSTCLTYVSSTPASSQSGNLVIFSLPATIAAGGSTCVNIVAQPNSLSCP